MSRVPRVPFFIFLLTFLAVSFRILVETEGNPQWKANKSPFWRVLDSVTQISLGNSRVSTARESSTYFVNGAVMLSAVLQRNAKHEARLSNISDLISVRTGPEMIRDSSPAPA